MITTAQGQKLTIKTVCLSHIQKIRFCKFTLPDTRISLLRLQAFKRKYHITKPKYLLPSPSPNSKHLVPSVLAYSRNLFLSCVRLLNSRFVGKGIVQCCSQSVGSNARVSFTIVDSMCRLSLKLLYSSLTS